MNTNIVLHVTVGEPSPEHVVHSWDWANKLAKKPERLYLNILDLGIDKIETIQNECVKINSNVTVQTNTQKRSGSSERHALGLNLALSNIEENTEDIHILADSDCYTILKGWDDVIEFLLKETDCIGATYENQGGFSSGTTKDQTYKNIPNCTWIALKPGCHWNKLDCTPQLGTLKGFLNEEDASIHNLTMNHRLLRDVGWKIPRFLHDNQYTSIGLLHAKSSGSAQSLKGLSDYHEEFQLAGIPILAHQRGASKHRFADGELSSKFIKSIDKWCTAQLQKEFLDCDDYKDRWTKLVR